ncbi:MAG: hypothetical protein D6680_16275 [Cyanobacteria bacterium J007]|nr:MAG: hypothetical protein D6680_16275 [Cyanobacteria bacterium J007]
MTFAFLLFQAVALTLDLHLHPTSKWANFYWSVHRRRASGRRSIFRSEQTSSFPSIAPVFIREQLLFFILTTVWINAKTHMLVKADIL